MCCIIQCLNQFICYIHLSLTKDPFDLILVNVIYSYEFKDRQFCVWKKKNKYIIWNVWQLMQLVNFWVRRLFSHISTKFTWKLLLEWTFDLILPNQFYFLLYKNERGCNFQWIFHGDQYKTDYFKHWTAQMCLVSRSTKSKINQIALIDMNIKLEKRNYRNLFGFLIL